MFETALSFISEEEDTKMKERESEKERNGQHELRMKELESQG